MPRIAVADVQAWVETTKLGSQFQALDVDALSQIEEEILVTIGSVYDTSTWIDKPSTPRIVQVIIAKMYAGWLYDKVYSENQSDPNKYAQLVKANAQTLINGIINGTIEIPGSPILNPSSATFYPTDVSSSQEPDGQDPLVNDMSLGPAKFSLGKSF
jgi:hypothetical protein